ncbi:tandem-95 repeat protein, partial [Aliikangiella coralliicola]
PTQPAISYSGSLYIGDTFTFKYISEPAILEYTVERNGETIYVGPSESLEQALPVGRHDYRVKARNSVGTTDWSSNYITVRDRMSVELSKATYNSDDNVEITFGVGGLNASDTIYFQLDDGDVISKTVGTHQLGMLSGGSHQVKAWGEYTGSDAQTHQTNIVVRNFSVKHRPVVTTQSVISVNEDESLIISLDDFTVIDADSLTSDMILAVGDGVNYSRTGNQITPDANFNGTLTVPVTVSDGQAVSETFSASVIVKSVNDLPVISEGEPLPSILEDTSIEITLSHLTISDVDSSSFTINIHENPAYSVVGNTVTPNANMSGTVVIFVSVSDGQDTSNTLRLMLVVNGVNDKPVIHYASLPNFNEDTSLAIDLSYVKTTDADNDELTLAVLDSPNYSRVGNTITPKADFNGTLTVALTVSDGILTSDVYNASVEVIVINDKPVITSHTIPAFDEDSSLNILTSHLDITDVDSSSFTLFVQDGANYSRNGNTIIPDANFNGSLIVPVVVGDGFANSDIFNATVTVNAVNDKP